MAPPLHISNQTRDKGQQFQFQTYEILLLTGVQKLHGPEISRFSTCMLTISGQYMAASHFLKLHRGDRSIHVGLSVKIRYLTLYLLQIFAFWTF